MLKEKIMLNMFTKVTTRRFVVVPVVRTRVTTASSASIQQQQRCTITTTATTAAKISVRVRNPFSYNHWYNNSYFRHRPALDSRCAACVLRRDGVSPTIRQLQQQQQPQPHQPPTPTSRLKKKKKPQQRKRKLLGSTNQPMTTKDRIRLLMETNQVIGYSSPHQSVLTVAAPAKDLLDLAQARMTYVRNSIYQYWNPDYKDEASSARGSISSSSSQVRTYKTGLVVMDTRWWIWNVLFALLPAIVITIYCETRGKRMMYAYHHQIEVDQLRQILGEQEFTIERANAIIAARDKDREEKEKMMWTGDVDEMAWKFIKTMIGTLWTSVTDIGRQLFYDLYYHYISKNTPATSSTADDESDGSTIKDHLPEGTTMPRSNDASPSTIPPTDQNGTVPPLLLVSTTTSDDGNSNNDNKSPSDNHLHPTDMPPSSDGVGAEQPSIRQNDTVVEHTSIEYLLQRIQQMEERIRQYQQQQQQQKLPSSSSAIQNEARSTDSDINEEDDHATAIRVIGQRMQKMNQSDVQNRFEIDAKQKWKKYISEVIQKEEGEENGGNQQEYNDRTRQRNNSNDTTGSSSLQSSSSSSTTGASSSSSSSVLEHIELFLSKYGTELYQEVQQRIRWSENNDSNHHHHHKNDTNVSNTIDDLPSTDTMKDQIRTLPPHRVSTVEDASTTASSSAMNLPDDSNPQFSSKESDSDASLAVSTTHTDLPQPVSIHRPWWKFF